MNDYCVSGHPIEQEVAGWALMPFVGERAHWWHTDNTRPPTIGPDGRVRHYVALCGLTGSVTAAVPALDEGNWPRCKHCQRLAAAFRKP